MWMGQCPGAFASLKVGTLVDWEVTRLTELWQLFPPVLSRCPFCHHSPQGTLEALQGPSDQLPIPNGELGTTDLGQLQQEKRDLEQQLLEKNKV